MTAAGMMTGVMCPDDAAYSVCYDVLSAGQET